MLPKPLECVGCLLYQTGHGFVPDERREVPVMIIGQNPGADEEHEGRPFVGQTGQRMEQTYLPRAGLAREQVSIANVIRCRWQGSNKLPAPSILNQAIEHCTRAHLRLPDACTHIVAQGALAFDLMRQGQLTRPNGDPMTVGEWRGYRLPLLYQGRQVFVVNHIAGLDRRSRDEKEGKTQATTAYVARADWTKLGQWVAGSWPRPRRKCAVVRGVDDLPRLLEWADQWRQHGRPAFVLDTEYPEPPDKPQVWLIGWYYELANVVYAVQVLVPESAPLVFQDTLQSVVQETWQTGHPICHNIQADAKALAHTWGVTLDHDHFDDTMLQHAALWCELPHDLEFIASMTSPYDKAKHLMATDPLAYHLGDLTDPWSAYVEHQASFERDPQVKAVYETQLRDNVRTVMGASTRGARTDVQAIQRLIPHYRDTHAAAQALAEAYCGWPINLASDPQLKEMIYDLEGMPVKKHRKTKRTTIDGDALLELRQGVYPDLDVEREEREGPSLDTCLAAVDRGAHPLLEARALASHCETLLTRYLGKMHTGRVFPEHKQHVQKNGRLSTSHPPLAQLPEPLRDLVIPDEGECFIGWDWNSIEPTIQMAETRSAFLRNVLTKGWDLHTIGLCDVMSAHYRGWEYPPNLSNPHTSPECEAWREARNWQGKDDKRRRKAKAIRYKKTYGGDDARSIPGIAVLGLPGHVLKQAGELILKSDPDTREWMAAIRRRVFERHERIARDWTGARRCFIQTSGHAMCREWFNFPMQRGVASIFNLTMRQLARELPYLRWVWHMNDSMYWACPLNRVQEALPTVRAIVEQPRLINGQDVPFPATFKVVYAPEYKEVA